MRIDDGRCIVRSLHRQMVAQLCQIFAARIKRASIASDLVIDFLDRNREYRELFFHGLQEKGDSNRNPFTDRKSADLNFFLMHYSSPNCFSKASTIFSIVSFASTPSTTIVIREFLVAASIRMLMMLFALIVSFRYVKYT